MLMSAMRHTRDTHRRRQRRDLHLAANLALFLAAGQNVVQEAVVSLCEPLVQTYSL